MAVPFDVVDGRPRLGTPETLFRTRIRRAGGGRDYTVSSDGRFLINALTEDASDENTVTVVVNWFEELTRRVPAQ